MGNDARIRLDVEFGKRSLDEMILSIVEQAMAASEGNRHRAARKLDVTTARVDRILGQKKSADLADGADLSDGEKLRITGLVKTD
jgi:hypothetical protein